jgi:hypothetical protein
MNAETRWQLADLPEESPARTNHTWNGEPMPTARHIILVEQENGPMIYRYSDDWKFAGDTWHQNMADALHQIDFEFGLSDPQWRTITEQEAMLLTKGR